MDILTVSLIAMGGALALEGAAWAIAPRAMRESYSQMFAMGDDMLHKAGLFSVAFGVIMIAAAVKMSSGS